MGTDELAIRKLVADWHASTARADVDAILPLMAEDVVFLVAGQAPFGRDGFEKGLRSLFQTHRIESSGEIREVHVSGDMAYCWSHIDVRVYPLGGGAPAVRAGNVLSILRKQPAGTWQIARDANLLVASGDS